MSEYGTVAVRTALLACGIFATAPMAFSAPPPIAAYNFDESNGNTLIDRSGNGHNGTLSNGPRWTSGKNGGALSFDGFNDYVKMGDVAQADGLRAVTVSAWVKFATAGGGANETHFVDKSGCNGYQNSGPWELGIGLTRPHKAEFVIYPQGGSPSTYIFSGASITEIDDANWHFVTGRYDGTYLSIWVDGVQENSVAVPGLTTTSSSYGLEIGGHCSTGTPYPFAGKIDDVRIYGSALSAAEIQADMVTPVDGGAAPQRDTTPPSAPASLNATNVSSTQATLSWQGSADNVGVVGYRLFRDGKQIATTSGAQFADSGLTASTSYTYVVDAYDAAGNISGSSNSLTITTAANYTPPPPPPPDTVPPSTPTALHSTSVTATQVAFAWQASTDNVGVTGYRVFRNGAQIGTTAGATFTDSGLAPSTSYTYVVDAYDASGNVSSASSPLSVTTADAAPAGGYTTNFGATENPISEGGKWVAGKTAGIDWNNPETNSGRAYASVLSGASGSRYDDSIAHLSTGYQKFNANQFAQGTVFIASGYSASHEVELLLHFTISGHFAQGYEVLWGATGYLAVVRWNGPPGDYTAVYDPGTGSIPVPRDGDVLRAEMSGNVITIKLNGNVVATVDVGILGTVWSSGQPGIGFWPVDNAVRQNYGWKSFSAGNL